MSTIVVLRCPADFLHLGENADYRRRPTFNGWLYRDRRHLTAQAIADCSEFICRPAYSSAFEQRFRHTLAEAIPFVSRRTEPREPVRLGLIRFNNFGQRCVILTIDGIPPVDLELTLPEPGDPMLGDPMFDAIDPVRPQLKPCYTHAQILRCVDGYMIIYEPTVVLQLELSWSEPITSASWPNDRT